MLGLLVLALTGRADEAAAVKAIKELGGTVERDDKLPGKPVSAVDFLKNTPTDAVLKELKELKSLQKLDLTATKVTDAGLKELKELNSLQWLYLYNTKVTAAGAEKLQKALPKLRIRGVK